MMKAKKTPAAQQSFDFEDSKALAQHLSLSRPLVFFDLETTGLDLQMDRIVQFAFVRLHPDNSVEEWAELVNPTIPIPPEATRVHGITDAMVAGEPLFSSFAGRIYEYLQNCDLAGFNVIRFDLPLLALEMERTGCKLDLTLHRVIDMQIIFHKCEPRDLTSAYRFYCQKELADAHQALADVRATVEILNGQIARYRDLPREINRLAGFCSVAEEDRWVTQDRKFYWRHNEAVVAFGKHKGKSLQWVHENDPDYLLWLRDRDVPEETRDLIGAALQGQYPRRASKRE